MLHHLTFLILFSSFSLTFAQEQHLICGQPSRQVLDLLAKSGTRWRGSSDWLTKLQMDSNYQGRTELAQTWARDYTGVPARAIRQAIKTNWSNENGLVASFQIDRTAQAVRVVSVITHRDVYQNSRSLVAQLIVALDQDANFTSEDGCSSCQDQVKSVIDPKTGELRRFVTTTCQSEFSINGLVQELLARISEARDLKV